MARSQGTCLTFIVLMIIGTVNAGRWLELEPYSTTSLISDGIDHENMLFYRENMLCESIYGFLPCADTMPEGVFLMIMYTYLMMSAEKWIGEGSNALFLLLGDQAFGASVFQVLMALPKIVLVIVGGVLSTESDARNQVSFGVSMYAGSTLIILTFIWGYCIVLNRERLHEKEPIPQHQQDSSTHCLPLKHKLSILVDYGVNVDKWTGETAVIMLLSLIPFVTVELVVLIQSPVTILFALIVSGVSLILYFIYQIGNPWIQRRSLAHLKEENLRIRFFYHIQRLAEGDLIDDHGNPNVEALKSIFERADLDKNGCISPDELELLIGEVFKLEKDYISKEYAKAEILNHFDEDKNGMINWLVFQKGCTKWLKKWKNDANTSCSISKNLWKQVVNVAIRNKRENLTKIEKIMPRILKQALEKYELVKENGHADIEKIEDFFSKYDHDRDHRIHRDELKEFIETLNFGVPLDHDAIFDELAKDFDKDNNCDTIDKNDFVEGFMRWIDKAIKHDPSIKDPKHAIAKFEEDCWAEIDTPINMVKPKASILYVIFGVTIMFLISGAFSKSIQEFANAAHIPYRLTSFVVFPIVMNARMVITAWLYVGPRVSKNAF